MYGCIVLTMMLNQLESFCLYLLQTKKHHQKLLSHTNQQTYWQLHLPYLIVSIHQLNNMSPDRLHGNFEVETNVKKFKEAKECDFFSVYTIKHEVYLSIAKGKTLLIMKWAPHPIMKFMKLKVFR